MKKFILFSLSVFLLSTYIAKAQICVDYPFNHITLLFNNSNDGFKRAFGHSSLCQEFIRRKDALDIFVICYETWPYKQLFEKRDEVNRNDELFNLFFLEKVVSETDFVVYLDSSDKRKLANIILHSHQSKKDYPIEFIGFHYNSSLCALLKILESDRVIFPNGEISLVRFHDVAGKEHFTNDGIDSTIVTKTLNYLNKWQ